MVLIYETTRPDHTEGDEERSCSYRFTPHNEHCALIYDSNDESMPTEVQIEAALMEEQHAIPPKFFVTPFDGLINHFSSSPPQHDVLQALMTDITKAVGKRENVTVVQRGAPWSHSLEAMLLAILQATKVSAEYAMQVVADEAAKEKQMQRLLQLESDGGIAGAAEAAGECEAPALVGSKETNLPLSASLKRRIQKLRCSGHIAAPLTKSSTPRYTIFSAAHGDTLSPPCQHGSNLVPLSFAIDPPKRRRTDAAMSVVREKNTRNPSVLFKEQKRRSTLALLAELQDGSRVKEYEVLPGNGWGSTIQSYVFDGESSVMALPGIPQFEDLVKAFRVDFFIRTDCRMVDGKRVLIQIMEGQRDDVGQLFQISLNWYEGMEETVRIFVRDAANRVLEALVSLKETELTLGKAFHHFFLHIQSLEEAKLSCMIDGKAAAIHIMQQEHPIAFNLWPHRLFVGGFLDESNSPAHVLRGSIVELRFWTDDSTPKPVVRWPLLVESGTLSERTQTISANHHETLQNLQHTEEAPPHTCPYFDGDLAVNMGTMSLWGDLMHHWRLEVRFRTEISNRMMTLVGVTDGKMKMQEVGIVLNAEPVFSKEHFRFRERNTTIYLVDAFGACCSALLRGTERESLVDGQWHTLVWHCVDSETNNFNVKIDGVRQNLLYVVREGPSRFLSLDNWVCVGGHNVRNWKVERHFTGQISRFYVSLWKTPFVTLMMDEGPGAYVLQDRSGHRNHGLLINASTHVVRRNDTVWMPVDEEHTRDAKPETQEDIVVYANNRVSVASVVFTCDFDKDNIPCEVVYDVYDQKNREMQVVDHHISDARPEWGSWRFISDDCFKPLETIAQLEESINNVLAAKIPQGHLLVVIRIGDCHVTLLQLHESQRPAGAAFDCNMLKWQYPYAVEGRHGRQELSLNRMVESVDEVLQRDTLAPFITARLGPLSSPHQSIVSEEIIRTLQSNSKPWYLALVLHALLLNTQYGSHLHIIQHHKAMMTYDDAAASTLRNKQLYNGAREKAALIIQRNWRAHQAKLEAVRRLDIRQARDRKIEEIHAVRMDAGVQAKTSLYALLVTLHHPSTPAVPPIEFSTDALEESLKKQNYEVDRLVNPPLAELMKAVSNVDVDRSSFVYIGGYGGQLNLRQPPLLALGLLQLSIQEEAARVYIASSLRQSTEAILRQFHEERAAAKSKRKTNKATSAASRPKRLSAEEEERLRREQGAARAVQLHELEQQMAVEREALVQSCDAEVQLMARTWREAITITKEYEQRYRRRGASGEAMNFVYATDCGCVEPYAPSVLDVEDVIRACLPQRVPAHGLQCMLAIDLEPVTPYSRGFACLASSTGNTLRFPYKPEQRRLLSWTLNKVFDGHLPQVAASAKYSVLYGGIETPPNQRDWKSVATYVLSKLRPTCTLEQLRALEAELHREVPFVAELIPVRDVIMTGDLKGRIRRDREAQKAKALLTFGVGSAKVQNDMFAVFKTILEGLPLSEITFKNTVHILFTGHNRGIDGVRKEELVQEIEACRPISCSIGVHVDFTSQGVSVAFSPQSSADKLFVTQWANSLVVRSLSWQIGVQYVNDYSKMEVDYIEFLYEIKLTCSVRRYRQLLKQKLYNPIPDKYVRFLQCTKLDGQ